MLECLYTECKFLKFDNKYFAGPLKVIYMNPDYTYGLTYQCFHVNPDDTCAVPVVDVIARSRNVSLETIWQVLDRSDVVCMKSQDFVAVSTDGVFSICLNKLIQFD